MNIVATLAKGLPCVSVISPTLHLYYNGALERTRERICVVAYGKGRTAGMIFHELHYTFLALYLPHSSRFSHRKRAPEMAARAPRPEKECVASPKKLPATRRWPEGVHWFLLAYR